MQDNYQKTLAEPLTFDGIGLHTGQTSKITILPGTEDQGIVFKRIDLKNNNLIKANYKNVSSAKLCTTLENSHGVKVSTVEHLLAAFFISGIDNATVEINCNEVPIMDGSAKEFLDVLKKVKTKKLQKKIKYLRVLEKVELIDEKRKMSIEPSDEFLEVDFQLNYDNQIIGKQKNIINFTKDNLNDVSNSRTFCLFDDIEKIKKSGLAKGGSLENAVVVDDQKVLNKGGLRNKKEFVNHKILDLVGDLLLSGHRILGKVKCFQGGHELTNMFLKKMLDSRTESIIIEEKKSETIKRFKPESPVKIAVNA
ncbi:UDP-3-O-acyl-N-acetylglucosamine deacetylase [Candidatus Pelagibacter bacterium]|nr:UDP-3-O-acyl-N-acetylglucosamine deacetylase [Candidatus Pelagibacter bacterium]